MFHQLCVASITRRGLWRTAKSVVGRFCVGHCDEHFGFGHCDEIWSCLRLFLVRMPIESLQLQPPLCIGWFASNFYLFDIEFESVAIAAEKCVAEPFALSNIAL
jgi:hypothetical protein